MLCPSGSTTYFLYINIQKQQYYNKNETILQHQQIPKQRNCPLIKAFRCFWDIQKDTKLIVISQLYFM